MRRPFRGLVFGVARDNDGIARLDEARGRAVEADIPGLPKNDVGMEAFPVGAVVYIYLLKRQEVGSLEELGTKGFLFRDR